jgi:hypothetical protein
MTNVKNAHDVNYLAGQIILSLKTERGKDKIYILVEGLNDRKVYKELFNNEKVRIEQANGKPHILLALDVLNKKTKQVIGICDADFYHLSKDSSQICNLFFTDYHDIEMTMLSVDDVLSSVLIKYDLQDEAQEILQKALENATFIGYIRWFNEEHKVGLRFSGLGLGNFVVQGDRNACLDRRNYLLELNKRSKDITKDISDSDIDNFKTDHYTDDIFNLCNGRDVVTIIALMIGKSTSYKKICAELRQSFNVEHFRKTRLYSDILRWQAETGFIIL